jgi:hypothetical protein
VKPTKLGPGVTIGSRTTARKLPAVRLATCVTVCVAVCHTVAVARPALLVTVTVARTVDVEKIVEAEVTKLVDSVVV